MSPRADELGGLYHALNRGNLRATIFHKPEDYVAFEKILHEALDIHKVVSEDKCMALCEVALYKAAIAVVLRCYRTHYGHTLFRTLAAATIGLVPNVAIGLVC